MPARGVVFTLEVCGKSLILFPVQLNERCEFKLMGATQDERHSYEKCQYDEFKLRLKKMDELKAQAAQQQS